MNAKHDTSAEFPSGCAIVFGGSGGLGSTITALLAERGSNVIATFNQGRSHTEQLVQSINAHNCGIAAAMHCQVDQPSSCQQLVDAALGRFGRVHTVVVAWGSSFETPPLAELSNDALRRILELDVIGFCNVARATLPAIRSGGGGSYVALTTTAVHRTYPGDALGSAPKSAVTAMIKQIALEEASSGIRANCVGPGVILAGMNLRMLDTSARDLLDLAVQTTPMRRAGEAREVAEAVAFLASTRASYITGQTLMVDGGLST